MDLIYESYQILESTEREYTDIIINEGFDKERIKEWIKNAWEKVKKFLSNVKKYISDVIEKVKKYVKTKGKTVKQIMDEFSNSKNKEQFEFIGYNFKKAKYKTTLEVLSAHDDFVDMLEHKGSGKYTYPLTEENTGIDKKETLKYNDVDWHEVRFLLEDKESLSILNEMIQQSEKSYKANEATLQKDKNLTDLDIDCLKNSIRVERLFVRIEQCHIIQSVQIFNHIIKLI